VEYRKLGLPNEERLCGAGVYYGAGASEAPLTRDEPVFIVGGGNSAGQAAINLASRARSVRVVVRGKELKSTMSHYLVDRIKSSPRIEVITETEVAAVNGTATVETATLRGADGSTEEVDCMAVYVMIGAEPCTEASDGMLAVDAAGYLVCGEAAVDCPGHLCWPLSDRKPHMLETIRPGVFAAGDVRAGASKRVAGAVGDGALVVRFAYDVLSGA
jgi:thioredoxin reductase (NADPH)